MFKCKAEKKDGTGEIEGFYFQGWYGIIKQTDGMIFTDNNERHEIKPETLKISFDDGNSWKTPVEIREAFWHYDEFDLF